MPVIVYTGTGNFDRCVQAVRLGAYGFIDKAEPMERVAHEIESAIERRRLRAEVEYSAPTARPGDSLVGGSAAMTELREAIARVAPIPSHGADHRARAARARSWSRAISTGSARSRRRRSSRSTAPRCPRA